MKLKIEENQLLMASDKFLKSLNAMLERFDVAKLSKDKKQAVDDWDDLPF